MRRKDPTTMTTTCGFAGAKADRDIPWEEKFGDGGSEE